MAFFKERSLFEVFRVRGARNGPKYFSRFMKNQYKKLFTSLLKIDNVDCSGFLGGKCPILTC